MQLTPYLFFDGRCAEAFRFYHSVLGGTLDISTFRDGPMASQMPPELLDRVLHAHLAAAGASLMGSDAPSEQYAAPQGFSVALTIDDTAEAERIFKALADGATVSMPFEKTFFAERFGMLVERFGISWMVSVGSV